jgi:hypothetical protein
MGYHVQDKVPLKPLTCNLLIRELKEGNELESRIDVTTLGNSPGVEAADHSIG